MALRSPLGRALGLGSAKDGVEHWWWQRLTAIALVPLSLWLVYSLVSVLGGGHAAVVDWMRSPVTAALLILFVATTFHHAQLGLQVVYEDYIHTEWLKVACLIGTKFAAVFFATVSVVSVLKVVFGN